jgi:hypothetical protein
LSTYTLAKGIQPMMNINFPLNDYSVN